jgi:DNA-binding transcriptional LysR family regulator
MNLNSMRFNRLDLNLLIGLDVLLSECSITRAAGRLCLSQSATSGVLARLRDFFGDELLMQSGRAMVPTPLALSLQAPVHDILLRIQSTVAAAIEFKPESTARHFRIVASDYVSTVVLAKVAAYLNHAAPFVTLEIVSPGEHAMTQLERGEIDLLVMPEHYLSKAHRSEVLFRDQFNCIVWNGHPEIGTELSETDFLRFGHVTTVFGSHQQVAFEAEYFKRIGLERRVEIVCSTFNLLPQFLIGTPRIATLQSRLAAQLARYYPIRLLEPPVAVPPIVECMQWRHLHDNDPGHTWLRGVLRQAVLDERMESGADTCLPHRCLPCV